MPASIVTTILATDRSGLVNTISETIAEHGGSWQESRMARLAGQFAGILRIECPEGSCEALIAALSDLERVGISIMARRESTVPAPPRELVGLDVIGNDRPGIIRSLSSAIAAAGANVEELATSLESAPMSGHPIFHARGSVSLPPGVDSAALVEAIEGLGPDLSVSVSSGLLTPG